VINVILSSDTLQSLIALRVVLLNVTRLKDILLSVLALNVSLESIC